jgi:hypothetical protein
VQLVSSQQRDQLFGEVEREAFHLELRDYYGTPAEDGVFASWRAGTLDHRAWLAAWSAVVRDLTATGKAVRRLRVVTEPISEYVRFEWEVTPDNLAAGEDIRWLPRHLLPVGIVFPRGGLDWWLFDDRVAAFGHFHEDGQVKGSEIVTDPAAVRQCAAVRDRLWPLAIRHDEYQPV